MSTFRSLSFLAVHRAREFVLATSLKKYIDCRECREQQSRTPETQGHGHNRVWSGGRWEYWQKLNFILPHHTHRRAHGEGWPDGRRRGLASHRNLRGRREPIQSSTPGAIEFGQHHGILPNSLSAPLGYGIHPYCTVRPSNRCPVRTTTEAQRSQRRRKRKSHWNSTNFLLCDLCVSVVKKFQPARQPNRWSPMRLRQTLVPTRLFELCECHRPPRAERELRRDLALIRLACRQAPSPCTHPRNRYLQITPSFKRDEP